MDSTDCGLRNENCGFFDIVSPEELLISDPGKNVARILGRDVDGMRYPDLVCLEDREAVTESLREVFTKGPLMDERKRFGRCIRHRIVLPDESVIIVSLTFGYNR